MRQLTRRQRIAAIVLAVVAACFITLDLGGSGLRSAHTGVRGSLGSLYRGTDAALGPVRTFVQGIPSAGSNHDKINALQHQNAQLRGQLAAAQANKQTTAQVAALQLAANSGGYSILPARVTALGPGEGFDWTVTLDIGSNSGVRVDQTVTDGHGLVGRVLHADPSSAVVLLGADPGSGVGVRDLRTGQVGVATGRGSSGFTFTPLDPSADVRVGDALATGPTGDTTFVPSLSVGTVTAVRTAGDGTTTAQVRATTAPTSLDLVGVILVGGEPVDRTALKPTTAPSVDAQGGH